MASAMRRPRLALATLARTAVGAVPAAGLGPGVAAVPAVGTSPDAVVAGACTYTGVVLAGAAVAAQVPPGIVGRTSVQCTLYDAFGAPLADVTWTTPGATASGVAVMPLGGTIPAELCTHVFALVGSGGVAPESPVTCEPVVPVPVR
jgi:hypothetical protein